MFTTRSFCLLTEAPLIHAEITMQEIRFIFAISYNPFMRECWPRSLGDCSSSLSKEHTVTAALFEPDVVYVQGLDWCKDEPKAIGFPYQMVMCSSLRRGESQKPYLSRGVTEGAHANALTEMKCLWPCAAGHRL